MDLLASSAESVVLLCFIVFGLEKNMISLTSVAVELVRADITERVIKGWKAIFAKTKIIHEKVKTACLHHIKALIICASPYYQAADANIEEQA